MKPNGLKVASIIVTVAGAGLSVLGSMLDDKKLDDKVAKAVSETLTKTKG